MKVLGFISQPITKVYFQYELYLPYNSNSYTHRKPVHRSRGHTGNLFTEVTMETCSTKKSYKKSVHRGHNGNLFTVTQRKPVH